ncbi:MAG: ATP-dependent sacrificial sulfur transferase LarE [Deltaproteobacteria bacterium]|nr:ATP-dependent sacrificial sulfur transferase LarE [Deltaproteobacteria bacterium]
MSLPDREPTAPAVVQARLLGREVELVEWFRRHGSVLIGYSGGVDSAYLACVARDAVGPRKMLAVIGRSASYPLEQWTRAREVADQFGVPVLEIDTDEMHDPRYAANPVNRCYYCKTELWSKLVPIARERGFAVVVDGSNHDDTADFRPGAQAGREAGVRSPLQELRLTKDDIRALSRFRGIPTWNQPASPCLSSRLPHGTEVTPLRLRKVENAERALRAIGVTGNVRVRYHGDTARLELDHDQMERWGAAARRDAVRTAVRAAGFTRVELDLRGFRSGSLNELTREERADARVLDLTEDA